MSNDTQVQSNKLDRDCGSATQIKLANCSTPHQPSDTSLIPPKKTKTQNIFFQGKWFSQYPWLHYVPNLQRVVCFSCAKASEMGLLNLASLQEPAFISVGFDNWKKARERFEAHQNSETHHFAVLQLQTTKRPTVEAQLDAVCPSIPSLCSSIRPGSMQTAFCCSSSYLHFMMT